MPSSDTFRIAHCSDPHWGRQFNHDIWDDFVAKTVAYRPHLILITGDCVDTPWHWTFREAKRDIDQLEEKVNDGRSPDDQCHIRMTPGNHDVRILGLIPVQPWITIPVVMALAGLILGLAWHVSVLSTLWSVGLFISALLLCVLIHQYCIGQFSRIFQDRVSHAPAPEQFTANHITVDLYSFDSASECLWWAGGMIRTLDFVSASRNPVVPPSPGGAGLASATSQLTYRIAMTHHHAVGIPHDHQYESRMILLNSGAFLSELTQQHIRLVLHGHKHRANFSRLTVNANQPDEFEIGVLGAGTVARGMTKREPSGYQFHFLELDGNLNMRATSYVSQGGAFHAQSAFHIEDVHQAIRRQRAFAAATYGIKAESIKALTSIVPDGDTLERVEYHAFQVTDSNCYYTGLPKPCHAIVDKGHIEGFTAGAIGNDCPPALHLSPSPDATQYTLRTQYGEVLFGSPIYAKNPPFSFYTEFHALNSVSMNIQQHEQRYGKEPQPRTERTTITTPVFPIDRLDIVVQFPKEFQISGDPELTIENVHSQRLHLIEQEYRQALFYDAVTNTIRCRVQAPPPETAFIIQWRLCHAGPPEARPIASLSGRTQQLQRTLLNITWGPNRGGLVPEMWEPVQLIAQMAEDFVREFLTTRDAASRDPIEVSLMIYDEDTRCLRTIGGNYPVDDPRAAKTLEYGDGLAGVSYKTNAMRMFIKALGNRHRPYGYLPWVGFPDPAGIPHEVLLCLPLTNPGNAALVYGVLNIGSARADSELLRLQETSDDTPEQRNGRKELYATLNRYCFNELAKSL